MGIYPRLNMGMQPRLDEGMYQNLDNQIQTAYKHLVVQRVRDEIRDRLAGYK